jgi:hypothetical protein
MKLNRAGQAKAQLKTTYIKARRSEGHMGINTMGQETFKEAINEMNSLSQTVTNFSSTPNDAHIHHHMLESICIT